MAVESLVELPVVWLASKLLAVIGKMIPAFEEQEVKLIYFNIKV